jgi:hypothetical protein
LSVGEYCWPGALFDDPKQVLAFGNIGSEACYAYLSTASHQLLVLPSSVSNLYGKNGLFGS